MQGVWLDFLPGCCRREKGQCSERGRIIRHKHTNRAGDKGQSCQGPVSYVSWYVGETRRASSGLIATSPPRCASTEKVTWLNSPPFPGEQAQFLLNLE